MSENYVEIGVAVIRRGNMVLIGKRPQNKVFGGKWEFPGGKVEPGESVEDCIIREILEEMGVRIGNLEFFTIKEHQYDHGKFRLHFYLAEILEGEPQALWHDEILWVEPAQLWEIDFLAADIGLVPLIQKKINLI